MDTKLSPVQADPRHDGDVVVLAPKDWTDAEEALSRLAHVASDRRRPTASSDFSAGPRVTEPPCDATLRPAALSDDPSPTDRPSLGRRASRDIARFLATACIGVVATLTWQSYGGTAKEMIASSAPQLSWLSSLPAIDPPSGRGIAVEEPSPPAVQASAPQPASAPQAASAPAGAVRRRPPPPLPSFSSWPRLQDLRRRAAKCRALAAGQEQMARDIAKLETAGQDIRRRISALPPAAAATARGACPPPRPALQSSMAPLPPRRRSPPLRHQRRRSRRSHYYDRQCRYAERHIGFRDAAPSTTLSACRARVRKPSGKRAVRKSKETTRFCRENGFSPTIPLPQLLCYLTPRNRGYGCGASSYI